MMIMKIKNTENRRLPKGVKKEEVIYNQSEIEFNFGDFDNEDCETITYNDFFVFSR